MAPLEKRIEIIAGIKDDHSDLLNTYLGWFSRDLVVIVTILNLGLTAVNSTYCIVEIILRSFQNGRRIGSPVGVSFALLKIWFPFGVLIKRKKDLASLNRGL